MTRTHSLAALTIAASALLLAASGHGAPAARPAAAEPPAAFAVCKACHSVDRGAPALVGPNLFGVVGSEAGGKPGYAYSPAMKAAGLRWTRARLDAFLANPQGTVPGTRMTIAGIADAAKRQAIIDYLATLK